MSYLPTDKSITYVVTLKISIMVKDRLHELKQLQGKDEKKENKTAEINSTQNESENEHKKLRKTFEQADVIGQWIEQMEKNNQYVRTDLKKIGDTKYNQKDVEEKLKSHFQNNTSIAHRISEKLKETDQEINKIKSDSTEGRIKNIQYTSQKTRFQQVFLENNQLLENYRNIQKQSIRAQLQAKGCIQITDEELTSLLDEGTDLQVFTDNILAETAEAKRILASVEERHQQLLQIERMLTEVRDLFVQMSILIDSQQELIDRIEYQAQQATDYIASIDLGAVRRSKKRYMKRKFYLILIITLVVIIIILILFYK